MGFSLVLLLINVSLYILNIFSANYLDNWKRIAVLKGDGNPAEVIGSSVPSGLMSILIYSQRKTV